MSRLIDADELLNFFDCYTSGTDEVTRDLVTEYSNGVDGNISEDEAVSMLYDFLEKVKNVIKTEPTVESESVEYGYWDNQDKCSICGYSVMSWNNTVKYCPNCGAKMDTAEEVPYQYMIQEVKNHKLMLGYNFSDEECNLLIKVLEKAEKYRWHDLLKDPDDLPEIMEQVLLKVQIDYDEYEYITGSRVTWNDNGWTCFGDPVAWKYIEQYEVE